MRQGSLGSTALPPPPDGGWGWVVVTVSFLCNLMLDGIAYSYGVLILPIMDAFECSQASASLVGSLLCGIYMLSGPAVSWLVNRFGCRIVCMVGSLISFVGLLVAAHATSFYVLMAAYGIVGGFGFGLIYLPSVIMCGYYFEKRRALATGIGVCGSGVGSFLFAPLSHALLLQFGWRGTITIFSGLILNCAVFGALMRPLQLVLVVDDTLHEDEDASSDDSNISESAEMRATMPDGRQLDQAAWHENACSSGVVDTIETETIVESDEEEEGDRDEKEARLKKEPTSAQDAAASRLVVTTRSARRQTVANLSADTCETESSRRVVQSHQRRGSRVPRRAASLSKAHLDQLTRSELDSGRANWQATHLKLSPVGIHIGHKDGGSRINLHTTINPMVRRDVYYTGSIAQLAEHMEADHHHEHQQGGASESSSRCRHPTDHSLNSSTNGGGAGTGQSEASRLHHYRHSIAQSSRSGSAVRGMSRGDVAEEVESLILLAKLKQKHMHRESRIDEDGESQSESAAMDQISGNSVRFAKVGQGLTSCVSLFDLNIFTDVRFVLVSASNVFGFLALYIPYMYLPQMSTVKADLSMNTASLIISAIGVANTVGRVIVGWLVDLPCVDALTVTNVSLLSSAVSVALLTLCTSFEAYVAVALTLGLSLASFIALTSIVLVDMIGIDRLTNAFGLLVSFRGLASIFGPPLAGHILETSGRLDAAFHIASGFFATASILGFLVQMPICRKMFHHK